MDIVKVAKGRAYVTPVAEDQNSYFNHHGLFLASSQEVIYATVVLMGAALPKQHELDLVPGDTVMYQRPLLSKGMYDAVDKDGNVFTLVHQDDLLAKLGPSKSKAASDLLPLGNWVICEVLHEDHYAGPVLVLAGRTKYVIRGRGKNVVPELGVGDEVCVKQNVATRLVTGAGDDFNREFVFLRDSNVLAIFDKKGDTVVGAPSQE